MTPAQKTERRYGGQTAAERRAARREKLLDAAVELFGTIGFAATTIEQLCQLARLHPRYFYEQFENREALLLAVYDRHVEGTMRAVVAALERAPRDPQDRPAAGLRAFVDAALADERLARINYFEMIGVTRALDERRRAVLRAFAEMVASQIEALDPDRRPRLTHPELSAIAVVGAVDGLITNALAVEPPADREALITALLELLGPTMAAPA
jgi:AcrR family transcriptional regulator